MRLLHVIPSYLPATRYGGPVFATHALCAALVRQGFEVDVFTTTIDGPRDVEAVPGEIVSMDGVRVRYFASPFLRRLYYAPALERAMREGPDYDLVHLHSVFLWPTWAAARAARERRIPYVLSPRGMLVEDLVRRRSTWAKRAWIALVERANIERAAAIHVTSDVESAELARFGFRLPAVHCVPNGVDASTSRGERPNDPEVIEPTVLALGRIHWKKGLDRLVEAIALVPEAKLLVVGNDEDRYSDTLRALALRHGVAARLQIRGPAFGAEKDRLYRRASLLALPSLSENFGNVVLEAMAAGCPVVVTPQVGAAEIVRESGGGRVAEGDPASLAHAIRSILLEPARHRASAHRAGEEIRRRYSWDAVAARMIGAYRTIAGTGLRP